MCVGGGVGEPVARYADVYKWQSYNVARLANALMTLLHIYGYGCSLTAGLSVVTGCDVECRPYRQTAPPPRRAAAVTDLVCSL